MDTETVTTKRAARRLTTKEEAAFNRILARVRANIPPDMTPEEIRAEIAEARREVRQERRARGC